MNRTQPEYSVSTKTVYPLDSDFEHTGNDTVFICVCVSERDCGAELRAGFRGASP